MRDYHDPISDAWEDAGLWMTNYREAHPEDDRDDIDIYLDTALYKPESLYWPLRDIHGTLIDFHVSRGTATLRGWHNAATATSTLKGMPMTDPAPFRFSPEVEAIMREVDTERIAREEVERLESHMDTIEAPGLTDDEVDRYMQVFMARIDAA